MLFYFTGAGNSLYVAKKIATHSNEKLISIANCITNKTFNFNLNNNEKVGFVFPIYFWGMPSIVVDFIKNINLNNYSQNYIFAVFTCGGSTGTTDKQMSKILAKKDINLSAAFSVLMPETYNVLFDFMNDPFEIPQIIASADEHLKNIYTEIDAEKSNYKLLKRGNFPYLYSFLAYPIYKYGRKTNKFKVNSSCESCGLCANICPIGIISMKNNKPVWKHGHCVHCLGCLHRCPQKAIDYGNKTVGRRRYINPASF